MEVAMFRAKLNILAGIVLIGSTAGFVPQVAFAEPVCSTGTVASGATQTQTFSLDATMRSHFTLESDQQDVALEVVDEANEVACATSLPNPGFQTCGWQPTEGATYTARIMRPLPTTVANASEDPIPVADDQNESHNVGQGSATATSVSDSTAGGSSTNAVVVVNSGPVTDANYTLCSDQSE
jgi:hypothetical protein